jgi:hypothetical protein
MNQSSGLIATTFAPLISAVFTLSLADKFTADQTRRINSGEMATFEYFQELLYIVLRHIYVRKPINFKLVQKDLLSLICSGSQD